MPEAIGLPVASESLTRTAARRPQEHCNFPCPGCGPPNYPDDAACPLKNCPQRYPGTPTNVGNDPEIFRDQTAEMHAFVVEDDVKVPANIAAGEWVVGFRSAAPNS